MKQLLYEGRFLAEITANVVRQENLKIVHNRIDWERIYRLADYHRIAPVMYLGLLGNGEVLPDRWSQRFPAISGNGYKLRTLEFENTMQNAFFSLSSFSSVCSSASHFTPYCRAS